MCIQTSNPSFCQQLMHCWHAANTLSEESKPLDLAMSISTVIQIRYNFYNFMFLYICRRPIIGKGMWLVENHVDKIAHFFTIFSFPFSLFLAPFFNFFFLSLLFIYLFGYFLPFSSISHWDVL
jgi:hypothetical protein